MPDATARHGPDGATGGRPAEPEPYDGGLLPALVARLREAGLDPDAEQLCDALWLARWTRGADTLEGAEGQDGPTAPSSRDRLPDAGPATPSTRTTAGRVRGTDAAPDDEPAEQGIPWPPTAA